HLSLHSFPTRRSSDLLLADHYRGVEPLYDATTEDLEEIHGIGPEVAESVHRFFSNPRTHKVLDRLFQAGVKPQVKLKPKGPQPRPEEHTSELQSPYDL